MQTDMCSRKKKKRVALITVVLLISMGILSSHLKGYFINWPTYHFSTRPATWVADMNVEATTQKYLNDPSYNYYQAQAVIQANLALAQWWH